MSFWRSWFGGGPAKTPAQAPPVQYNGFTIRAEPFLDNGQYQTAGVIEKELDGTLRQHRFIRADRHPGLEEATQFTLAKAKQIIDQMGDGIFAERP